MKMSITRALTELKTINARIEKQVDNTSFIAGVIGKGGIPGFASIKEYEDRAKSTYQSIQDLIKRRNAIKSAVVISNAQTAVTVSGKQMTVAEAIERKQAINLDKMLLNKLRSSWQYVVREVEKKNEQVQDRLDKQLEALIGKDARLKSDEHEGFIKTFKEQNEAVVIDPLDIKAEIDKITKNIEEFETEVDFVLSESNTVTFIDIED